MNAKPLPQPRLVKRPDPDARGASLPQGGQVRPLRVERGAHQPRSQAEAKGGNRKFEVSREEIEGLLEQAKALAKTLADKIEDCRSLKSGNLDRALGILDKLRTRARDLGVELGELPTDGEEIQAQTLLLEARQIAKKTSAFIQRQATGTVGSISWTTGNTPQFLGLMVAMARSLGYPVGLTAPEGAAGNRFLLLELPEGQVSFKVVPGLLEQAGLSGLPEPGRPWDGHDTSAKSERIRAHVAAKRGGASCRSKG